MTRRRLLITGGAGFCGTHLAERFAGRFDICLFDNFRRDSLRHSPQLLATPNVEVVSGDMLDVNAVRGAVAGADAVIHCAAVAGVSSYYERAVETLRVNIIGTFNLLDALVECAVPRLIYFSTSEIYGPQADNAVESAIPSSGPVSERRWVYSVSKLAGEHAVLRYGETLNFAATVVRPFNIYGPRQTGEGAISNFARRIALGRPLEIYGDGTDIRAWCHVRDLVTAVELMLDAPQAHGQVFNIGNPEARMTTRELADRMLSLAGGGSIVSVPSQHSPIQRRSPNIELARRTLGFTPIVGLDEGLRDTLAWFCEIKP